MTERTIIINNASEITNAKGKLNSRKCKPVICIDTGEVFTSATDAAESNGTTVYNISTVCLGKTKKAKGKRFCYLADVDEHLEEITTRIQKMNSAQAELEAKAAAYDAYIKAKQQRERDIADVTETLARARQARMDLEVRLHEMQEREIALELQLENLKTNEVVLE